MRRLAAVHGVVNSQTRLSDLNFTFHFHALEKEMTTYSSVLAWRIPGTWSLVGCRLWGHTVRHDWSDLAAAAGIKSVNDPIVDGRLQFQLELSIIQHMEKNMISQIFLEILLIKSDHLQGRLVKCENFFAWIDWIVFVTEWLDVA